MYVLTVIIKTTNVKQPIIPAAVTPDSMHPFQSMIPQNNGSNDMTLGDENVTATNGLYLASGGSAGGLQQMLSYGSVLDEFYVLGTAGDRLNIMVL